MVGNAPTEWNPFEYDLFWINKPFALQDVMCFVILHECEVSLAGDCFCSVCVIHARLNLAYLVYQRIRTPANTLNFEYCDMTSENRNIVVIIDVLC
jgi:hypothetical protein